MKMDELTIGEAKELASMLKASSQSHSLPVGKQVIIRTVTHYYTGRIVAVTDSDCVLEDAAWIADTGRWSDALRNSTANEVEPYIDPVIISRGTIVDVTLWRGKLPTEQK